LSGVAANDCHHNNVLIVKMVNPETVRIGTNVDADDQMQVVSAALRPGIRAMTRGHQPGDVLARVDIDPYQRSFRNLSTHVLAPELSETAVRDALRQGHAYVCHDWMCDPSNSRFELLRAAGVPPVVMGDEVNFAPGERLVARFPVSCRLRLLNGGRLVAELVADRLEQEVAAPGVYRVEAWLEIGGEERPWLFTNPIYVR
jgi:hypothetical protein